MTKAINAILTTGALLVGLCGPAFAEMKDVKGSQDSTLFSRMPNFKIIQYRDTEFDAHKFWVTEAGKHKTQPVEGHLTYWKYVFDKSSGATPPSKLQIIRNYQAAAAKIGGKVIYDGPHQSTVTISRDGSNVWLDVNPVSTGAEYSLWILEQQAMAQDVVADAAALQAGLSSSGHVELQGVFFDTGKSELKPESEAALKEIAKMLQQSGELKVWVVGHTDSVGSTESNLALSSARAAAVVKYLTGTLEINPKRLGSHGAGPYAPVGSNATEEGRARNRRVELVAQP